MSVYQSRYLEPGAASLDTESFWKGREVRAFCRQNADVAVLCDMLSGAMLYHLLFQPEEPSDKKAPAYLLRLFQQAGLGIPNSGIEPG